MITHDHFNARRVSSRSSAPARLARILVLAGTSVGLIAPAAALAFDLHDFSCEHCRAEFARAMARRDTGPRADEFDAATGRDLRNFAPDRSADLQHLKLELTIPDMNIPRLSGVATISFEAIGSPVDRIVLNAHLLRIEGVEFQGKPVPYEHDGRTLRIRIEPPLPEGQRDDVTVRYTLNDPPEGLTWTLESPAWPGRPAQIHTQGQPETNRYWFPTHDSPNERLSTETIVTVPEGYQVVSNGKLLSRKVTDNPDFVGGKAETFHYLQRKEHVSYLVSLIVGKFDVVDVGTKELPMPVFVPPGTGPLVQQTYGRTPQMMRVFQNVLEEQYPWDQYAQTVVWNFGAGGMENTSATTMYDTAILSKQALLDGDLDRLIAHELAHQWFGNFLTCNSWEHIWLNEGFATYFESVWLEERDGVNSYYWGIWNDRTRLAMNDAPDARNDTPSAPEAQGMASKVYREPWDVFRRPANPYPKGSLVLHMLRVRYGDNLFRQMLIEYVERHKNRTVETSDFRKVVEDLSGESLERFFNQWVYRPGVPRVRVSPRWIAGTKTLEVEIEQLQNIDAWNPAFDLDIPVWVSMTDDPGVSDWIKLPARTETRTNVARFELNREPRLITVDPMLASAAIYEVQSPAPMLARLINNGPTLVSRLQAMSDLDRASRGPDNALSAESARPLVEIARNERAFFATRVHALTTLGRARSASLLTDLARSPAKDARVRRAYADAVGRLIGENSGRDLDEPTRQAVLAALAPLAQSDESFATRASALRSLGRLNDERAIPIILAALEQESQHDQIRQGAIDALGRMKRPETLPALVRMTDPGRLNRTRAAAIRAIGEFAPVAPSQVAEALMPLLLDRESRVVRSAGEVLSTLADPRVGEALTRHAGAARSDNQKRQAQAWLESSRRSSDPAAATLARAQEEDRQRAERERLAAQAALTAEQLRAAMSQDDAARTADMERVRQERERLEQDRAAMEAARLAGDADRQRLEAERDAERRRAEQERSAREATIARMEEERRAREAAALQAEQERQAREAAALKAEQERRAREEAAARAEQERQAAELARQRAAEAEAQQQRLRDEKKRMQDELEAARQRTEQIRKEMQDQIAALEREREAARQAALAAEAAQAAQAAQPAPQPPTAPIEPTPQPAPAPTTPAQPSADSTPAVDAQLRELRTQQQILADQLRSAQEEQARMALELQNARAERERLAQQRTAPAASATTPAAALIRDPAWLPIRSIADWVQGDAELREASMDPAGFFARYGFIVETYNGTHYLLVWNRPGFRLTQQTGAWRVLRTLVANDANGHFVQFTLDDTGARLLGDLTQANIGRNMAIIVNDVVYLAPQIASRVGRQAQLAGSFSAEEANKLSQDLSRPGALTMRIAVSPGELPGERDLRQDMLLYGPAGKPPTP
jgi:aminopeptidase N